MDFLKEFEISDETINVIKENFCIQDQEEIINSQDRIYSSILYLREIGVNNNIIEDIILEDYSLLVPGEDKIRFALSKIGEKEFVRLIEEDFMNYKYLNDIY